MRNKTAFEARYGTDHSDRIAGEYAPTRLENAGERLHLVDGLGNTIADFRYNDRTPWPEAAGREGVSMVLDSSALPEPDYDVAGNWTSSALIGGTPNADETFEGFTGEAAADEDGDGYPRLIEYVLGTSDNDPGDTTNRISIATADLPGGSALTMSFRRISDTVNVNLIPQFSVDLENWFGGEDFVSLVSAEDQKDGTTIVTYRATPEGQQDISRLFMRLRAEVTRD